MKKTLLGLATLAVYLLHQDFWFWRTARPLVFGFVPIGLVYHAAYCVLASLLLWLLVTHAWPAAARARGRARAHEDRRP